MALKKALIWGGGQTVFRMILSFVSIKVTTVYLGPAGLAMVGQVSNFISLLQGSIGDAIQTGVIKKTAEVKGKRQELQPLWSTALRLVLLIGSMVGVLLASFAEQISNRLLGSGEFWPLIVLIGFSLPYILVNTVLTGALNGLKELQTLGILGIASTLLGAMIFIPLSYYYGIWGGVIGTILSYACVFFCTAIIIGGSRSIKLVEFSGRWNRDIAKSLIAFYPMLLVHSVSVPMAPLLVRDALVNQLGTDAAGYWQASIRLSDMYTQVLLTTVSLYLMPHLSEISDRGAFCREVAITAFKLTVLTVILAVTLYLLRDIVILTVFTPKFNPVKEIMPYQLLGDVLKMAGYPIRMALSIQMRTTWYVCIEVAITGAWVGLTYLWIPKLGTEAATLAYACAWGGGMVMAAFGLRRK